MPSAPPVLFGRAAVCAPGCITAVPLYRAVREIEHLRPTVFPPWIDVGHGSSSDCAALVAAYLDRGPTPRVVQSARGQSPLDGTQLGMRSEQLRKYPSGHLYPPAVTERAHPAFRGPRAELGRLTPPRQPRGRHTLTAAWRLFWPSCRSGRNAGSRCAVFTVTPAPYTADTDRHPEGTER